MPNSFMIAWVIWLPATGTLRLKTRPASRKIRSVERAPMSTTSVHGGRLS